jgi:hypothetical protein
VFCKYLVLGFVCCCYLCSHLVHAGGSGTVATNPMTSSRWAHPALANICPSWRVQECLNTLRNRCPYCWFSGRANINHQPMTCIKSRGMRYSSYREAVRVPMYQEGTCYGCGLEVHKLSHGNLWGQTVLTATASSVEIIL